MSENSYTYILARVMRVISTPGNLEVSSVPRPGYETARHGQHNPKALFPTAKVKTQGEREAFHEIIPTTSTVSSTHLGPYSFCCRLRNTPTGCPFSVSLHESKT